MERRLRMVRTKALFFAATRRLFPAARIEAKSYWKTNSFVLSFFAC
jgi:hypothetical protein